MRYLILHCRHCTQRLWVPETKIGATGRCPDCGATVKVPADLGNHALFEGPHYLRDSNAVADEPSLQDLEATEMLLR
jgi:hypothetical protein